MKRIAGTVLLIGITLGFATAAHAGTITYWRECGPDGNTIVHLTVQNGYLTVYVDDVLAPSGTVTTGPGTHKVEWWGYPTSDGVRVDGPDVMWDRKFITVDPSNCPQPTTTSAPAPTTTEAVPTDSEVPTTPPPTAPVATIPPINETVCLDEPAGCEPPADVTGTTVPVLPATGQDNTVLLVCALMVILGGAGMVLTGRRAA